MDEVCENCSRIAVMESGKIVKVGSAEEVFKTQADRLSLPVTARLKNTLSKAGLQEDLPLKTNEFIEAVANLRNKKG